MALCWTGSVAQHRPVTTFEIPEVRPVRRIGYGAMQLEHGADEAARAVLRRVVELGVDHVDTCLLYTSDAADE